MNKSFLHRHGPSPSQLLAESLDSLRLLGRQSMLALLGIVVGNASIIALLNIGRNAADESIRAFNDMGTEILVVSFPHSPQDNRPFPSTLNTDALKESGAGHRACRPNHNTFDACKLQWSSCRGYSCRHHRRLGFNRRSANPRRPLSVRLRSSRNFCRGRGASRPDLAAKGNPLQIGDLLQIENYLFQVIGIAESLPASALIPVAVDESVILPIGSMRRVRPVPEIGSVIGKVAATADLPATAKALHNYLTGWLAGREVEVQIPQHLFDGLKRQANMFSYLLAGLGVISLLVGGVGVMNVMLMNVSARRIEIGVRMALGARPRDIRSLFLWEAGTLSVVGALLGALLGLAVVYVFTRVSGWQFTLVPESLLFGCGSSLLIGLFFGLYPAISASRLQPVQALRDV
ncbi:MULTISPECIES: ABC transporter permease [Methylobacter]